MPIINGTSSSEDLKGTGGFDSISGFGGDDRLYGHEGDDVLDGGTGDDRLKGEAGADTMLGGAGNDVYVVEDVGDVVSEEASPGLDSGGLDTVQSSISYVLGAFVEKLQLLDTADLNGAGNALANQLKGNSGSNVLTGGAGNDTLIGNEGDDMLIGGLDKDQLDGGAGADTLVFGLNQGAADVVKNFESVDRIGISAAEFSLAEGAGLSGGQLAPSYFVVGSSATASGHGQFVFTTGSSPALRWDPDGTGAQAAVTLATFPSGSSLSASRFQILSDTPPTASVFATSATPQPEDNGQVFFTLALSHPWSEDVILTVSTQDGSAHSGSDYTALSDLEIHLVAGQTSAQVGVTIADDGQSEPTETLSLHIDSAVIANTGAALAIGTASATASITDPAPPQLADPSVVNIQNTWAFGIPDPSGIAYNPATGRLMLSDAEMEESPFSNPVSFYAFALSGGAPTASFTPNYTTEPTGLAIDATRGVMYVSDDDKDTVNVVSPSNPSTRLWSFKTLSFGGDDAEDVAVDPVTGNVFIVNGLSRSVQELSVNHANRTVSLVDSFTFSDAAIKDPEAIAYDPVHDFFLVGGGFSADIWLVDRDGDTVEMLPLLRDHRNPKTDSGSGTVRVGVKDIELAPASDGSGDTHIYVADFGNSHKMDGRIIEIDPGNLFSQIA